MSEDIVIVGAGLTGLTCALHLCKLGYNVTILESRSLQELQKEDYEINRKPGRTMSMDISARGLLALKSINAASSVKQFSTPMYEKIFHTEEGTLLRIPYGRSTREHILTISRSKLFSILFDLCRNIKNIQFLFSANIKHICFENRSISFTQKDSAKEKQLSPRVLIGCDGINSIVRSNLAEKCGLSISRSFFPHGYKELRINRDLGNNLVKDAMHIWPRKEMMLVAQPNFDHSFTCALLLKLEGGTNSFAFLNNQKRVENFFKQHFFDLVQMIPDLTQQFQKNPVGTLNILTCQNWTANSWALLMGDAAHAMVPFFGQGVNCCFEDCTILSLVLRENNFDWEKSIKQFSKLRVKNANAICQLSSENYPELFPNHDIKKLLLKKQIDAILNRRFKNHYRNYHNLVCFDHVPYLYAQRIKPLQEKILDRLSAKLSHVNQLELAKIKPEIEWYADAMIRWEQ